MRNIFIIAKRDLRAQFNSPVAYVVIGGTVLLLGVMFFLIPHVGGIFMGSFWEIDRATMDSMFLYLPPLMSLFVVPAVTMRSLAAEKGSGTLELLITMPVRDTDVILGKYFASCAMVLVLLLATMIYPIAMFAGCPWHLGPLDWGPVWAGYLGCAFFGFAAVALGMMLSSLTESDVIAFFTTAAALSFLYALGPLVSLMPSDGAWGFLSDGIAYVSFQRQLQSFVRGIIDARAVVYFLSVMVICLLVSFRSLESRKWS